MADGKEFLRIVVKLLSYNRRSAVALLFFSLLLAGIGVLPPLAVKVLFDSLQLNQFSAATKWVIIAIVLFFGADLGGLLNGYLVKTFQARIIVWLRERFALSLYTTDRILRNKWDTGYVLGRYNETNELNALLLETISVLLTQFLVFCTAIAFLFLWIPFVAIAVILTTPMVIYLSFRMKTRLEHMATKFQEVEAKTNSRLGEIVQKWQSSVFQTKELMLERHRSSLYSLYETFVSYQATNYKYLAGLHLVNSILLGCFWFIGVKLHFAGRLSLGALSGGSSFLSQCTSALQSFADSLGQISFALAAYRRVADFVEVKPPISPFLLSGKVTSISFKDVGLQFEGNKLIEDLSFECRAGEWVVCIGENGSGKTSLLRLVAGLELPTSGRIVVNHLLGIPYFSEDWMKRIVYIEPDPLIIDGTIKENLAPVNGKITQEEIEKLFRSLGYRPFWNDLPMGIEAEIESSRDTVLSHGQRQLIEWVRWLLHPPRELYLLDEPLTGVAADVKRKCLEALKAHAPDGIVILTTQEPELRESADHLLIFQKQKPVTVIKERASRIVLELR